MQPSTKSESLTPRDGEPTSEKGNSLTPSPESRSTDSQKGLPTEGYLQLTEDGIKAAIIEARGDIFIASQLLRVTAIRLDRAISVSPVLQTVMETVRQSKPSPSVSNEELSAAVERRIAIYRVAGLDALHDLATMEIDANSAQNQVKLAAAARLAGPTEGSSGGGELAETLRELQKSYAAEAPRLRVIRERTTIETLPPERAVNEAE